MRWTRHPQPRAPSTASTLNREHPQPRAPSTASTLNREHPQPRAPSTASTLNREHPQPRAPSTASTLNREHPHPSPLPQAGEGTRGTAVRSCFLCFLTATFGLSKLGIRVRVFTNATLLDKPAVAPAFGIGFARGWATSESSWIPNKLS